MHANHTCTKQTHTTLLSHTHLYAFPLLILPLLQTSVQKCHQLVPNLQYHRSHQNVPATQTTHAMVSLHKTIGTLSNISPPTHLSPAKEVITTTHIAFMNAFYIHKQRPRLDTSCTNLNHTHNIDHYPIHQTFPHNPYSTNST